MLSRSKYVAFPTPRAALEKHDDVELSTNGRSQKQVRTSRFMRRNRTTKQTHVEFEVMPTTALNMHIYVRASLSLSLHIYIYIYICLYIYIYIIYIYTHDNASDNQRFRPPGQGDAVRRGPFLKGTAVCVLCFVLCVVCMCVCVLCVCVCVCGFVSFCVLFLFYVCCLRFVYFLWCVLCVQQTCSFSFDSLSIRSQRAPWPLHADRRRELKGAKAPDEPGSA